MGGPRDGRRPARLPFAVTKPSLFRDDLLVLQSGSKRRLPPLLAALLLAMGCGGGVELPPPSGSDLVGPASVESFPYSVNLASILPLADLEVESREIDFSALEDASSLGRGWSLEPTLGKAWGVGAGSSLEFVVLPPRRLELELRCAPFHFPGSPRQHLTVSVNGRRLEAIRLWKMMRSYRVEIPADLLRFGSNQLELSYSYAAIPAEVVPEAEDGRKLAVLFERLRFVEAPPVEPPVASGGGTRLELPFASQASFFLELGPESSVRLAGVEATGEPDPRPWRLRLEAETDGSDAAATIDLGPEELTGPVEIRLPTRRTGERTRITLAAYSSSIGSGGGGLEIDLPEVISGDEELAARLAARSERRRTSGSAEARRPNVLIYMIDTLRADHLGVYGYDRPTSPEIDAFAGDATLFRRAVAQSSWTKPAVATLLTGLNPQLHGVNDRKDKLADEAHTLAEYLWEAGYDTAAIFTNGNLSHMGLGQGYKHYRHLREGSHRAIHVLSDRLRDEAVHWLAQRDRSKPFYLYLHATDPHSPYTPPPGYLERIGARVEDPDAGLIEKVKELERGVVDPTVLADLVALYDAEIAFNDHQFGRLLDELRRQGLYDDTLIILLSDHGEEFFDHGWWQHGKTLYQEQLAVPLVVRFPAGRGAGDEVEALAQHIDILPTVLDLAGVEWPEDLPGRSLVPRPAGGAPIGAPVHAVSYLQLDNRRAESVTTEDAKLILHHYDLGPGRLLFDLVADAAEERNLYDRRPVLAGFLMSMLDAFHLAHQRRLTPEEGEFDPELTERLRALGYLN